MLQRCRTAGIGFLLLWVLCIGLLGCPKRATEPPPAPPAETASRPSETTGRGGSFFPVEPGIPRSSSSGSPTSNRNRRERRSSFGRGDSAPMPASAQELQLALGNPSGATPDPANAENYLIQRPQYAVSYNAPAGRPNWVSWRVGRENLGSVSRGQFQPDPDLPASFPRITPRDYTGSGYDRGHLCPSGDRSASPQDNDVTFYMTNIFPQAPGNNQGPWRVLEEYTRQQVEQGQVAYVLAGVSGGSRRKLKGKVQIPAVTWKVIVFLPEPEGNDVARIGPQTRVLAVKMPNTDDIRSRDWRDFLTRAADIEALTNYRLFTSLPEAARSALLNRPPAE